jgi:hypothetical protein
VLLGRRRECDQLEQLLAEVRGGTSRVLVLRGEPGAGKTALLDHAEEAATGCRVLRAAGVETETELAYAGLQQLCAAGARRPPARAAADGRRGGVRAGVASRRLEAWSPLGILSSTRWSRVCSTGGHLSGRCWPG